MKFVFAFLLTLISSIYSFAAMPSFYLVDIRANNDAVLHTTNPEIRTKGQLKIVFLSSAGPICCFNFGSQKSNVKSSAKIDNDNPLLISDRGAETFQFAGFFRGTKGTRPEDGLAFGFEEMSDVKIKGKRVFEVLFSDKSDPLYVRQCLGSEGVNFYLFHSLSEKKPFANYYYSLGYDVEADCPSYK